MAKKMGRPTKTAQEKRKYILNIAFTTEEASRLKLLCKQAGATSLAEYCRTQIFGRGR
jgi:hypothetical protein